MYGFDKQHLYDAATSDLKLFAIFTEFQMLPTAKRFLVEQGMNVTTILIEASEDTLINRSFRR